MNSLINNPENFHKFVLDYCLLIDNAFETYNTIQESDKPVYKEKIKDLVNVLSYLRGEGSVFPRITRLSYVDEYYRLENAYFEKLDSLQ